MVRYFLLSIGIVCLAYSAPAQPDTALIGVYVTDLYDVNLSDNSFSTQFWVWFNYNNKDLQPLDSMEILNEKSSASSNSFTEQGENGVYWSGKKFNAVIKKEWDIRYFPFDEQKMSIEFEESNHDTEELVYKADAANTKLDPGLKIANWKIVNYELAVSKRLYATTFGDPELKDGASEYAHATLDIFIKRNGWGLFFSMFTGMYVAFFISLLVFFIDPHHVDPRFGLSVGGLFAAVGNKYIVDSVLPQSTTFTLVDKLHIITYISLLTCIVLSVRSLRLWNNGNVNASKRSDRWSWKIILGIYVILNLSFVWQASQGR